MVEEVRRFGEGKEVYICTYACVHACMYVRADVFVLARTHRSGGQNQISSHNGGTLSLTQLSKQLCVCSAWIQKSAFEAAAAASPAGESCRFFSFFLPRACCE